MKLVMLRAKPKCKTQDPPDGGAISLCMIYSMLLKGL